MKRVENNPELNDKVKIEATFCFENCQGGPTIKIGDEIIGNLTADSTDEVLGKIEKKISA